MADIKIKRIRFVPGTTDLRKEELRLVDTAWAPEIDATWLTHAGVVTLKKPGDFGWNLVIPLHMVEAMEPYE